MIRKRDNILLFALLMVVITGGYVQAAETGAQNVSISGLSQMPIQFVANSGQASDDVRFMVNSMSYSFDFTNTSMVVSGVVNSSENQSLATGSPLLVTVKGAGNNTVVTGDDQLPGYANFIKGENQSEWRTNLPWYGAIRYTDILPGINLTYSGKTGRLKREYTVSPGADPTSIRLIYSGGSNLTLLPDGSLSVTTAFGTLNEAAPVSYQNLSGREVPVNTSYRILSDTEVGYDIGAYDTSSPLIIDPTLVYSTYFGGSLEDYGMGIAVDSSGNAYVTGYTSSCDLPIYHPMVTSAPAYNGTLLHASVDAFVTEIHQETGGNASIVFSTYIGGSGSDKANAISLDSAKSIYITGETDSTDFPVLNPISTVKGSGDVFVTKIRNDGAGLIYSTYLGGTGEDAGNAIAVDSNLNAYVTGTTKGSSSSKTSAQNYPTTSGAYMTVPKGGITQTDAFISELASSGNSLVYSSFIGGSNDDSGNGVAVYSPSVVYIAGTTSSSDLLPSGVMQYASSLKGAQDAFLFKMNLSSSTAPVTYATYLGGSSSNDYGEGVTVDSSDCAYLTGSTASADFPVTSGSYQTQKGDPLDSFEKDAYVTKFSSDGSGLVYSTFLGGSENDGGYGVAVDSIGQAFVTGYTSSSNFPTLNSIKVCQSGMGKEGFLTCLKPAGSALNFSTVFGGYEDEVSHSVALGPENSSYVTGWTASPSMQMCTSGSGCSDQAFPTQNWINQNVKLNGTDELYSGGNFTGIYGSSFDAFVMKFGVTQSLTAKMSSNVTCGDAPLVVQFFDNSTGSNIVSRLWNYGDNSAVESYSTAENPVHNYTTAGSYTPSLTIYGSSGTSTTSEMIYACGSDMSDNFTISGVNCTYEPLNVSVGSSLNFIGSANFTPSLYNWNFNDGTANQTGQSVYHTYASQGSYHVILTASSGACCPNASIMRVVRAYKPPMAYFENATGSDRINICPGAEVSFTDLSYNGTNYGAPTSWNWNFGDNTTNSTDQNPHHTYEYYGNYPVTLTVSNPAGSSTYQRQNYVSVGGYAAPGFEGNPRTGLSPLPVQFTDLSTAAVTYSWNFGDGNTSTERNPSHTYYTIGSYSVTQAVAGACGGSNSTTYGGYITVNGNISPIIYMGPLTHPATSLPVNSSVKPLTVYMQGNTTDGSLIDDAWWNFGNNSTVVHQTRESSWPKDNTYFNTSYTYNVYGDFTPVLNISNNTWPTTPTPTTGALYKDFIGVYRPLLANFTYSPTTAVVGQSIQFTDTSSGNPKNWSWTFGNPAEGSASIQNPAYAFAYSGSQLVRLEGTNKYGDHNSSSRILTINPADNTYSLQFVPQSIQMISGGLSTRKVAIMLNKADYGLNSYTLRMNITNESIVNFKNQVTAPDWGSAYNLIFGYNITQGSGGYNKYVNISGFLSSGMLPAGQTNVTLGTLVLNGTSAGTATINLLSSSTVQANSTFMNLSCSPGSITVYRVGTIAGQSNPPQDLNGDGLIDDFNGDGVINTYDVIVFFNAWNAGTLSGIPISTIDYNSNGVLDTDDIVKYFKTVVAA